MALELETQIMGEIGFGNHYTWYNGSRSCGSVRIAAARKLHTTIQIHHDRGEEISLPNGNLIDTLKQIAIPGDDSDLTRTWEAASYVIAEHIYQAKVSEEDRNKAFKNLDKYLRKNYLPEGFEEGIDMNYANGIEIVWRR